MSVFLQPIYTQTVGSGGASTVTFNNIPQTFTDLMCVISARAVYQGDADAYMWFNGSQGTAYSWTKMQGNGSSAPTYRGSNGDVLSPWTLKGDGTANTFGNAQIYVPYYTQSGFKQVVSESAVENNATVGFTTIAAGLWRNTSAVTAISFTVFQGFTQHSTFTLYGITKG
jgi:hypothetical protein